MTTTIRTGTLDGWFRGSVARYGDETALEVAERRLTYRQLDSWAGAVAASLASACGGAPRRVGLLAGRTAASYAGYLAVLRLGVTVVPLHPDFPQARTAAVCRAAGLDAVLVGVEAAAAAEGLSVPVLHALEPGPPDVPAAPDAAGGAAADGLAYILFTSGSTGAPKGVPVTHANVDAYLREMVPRCAAGPGSRFSQTFDRTFDVSVLDMFVAWASGAALVVPDKDEVLAPVRFVNERGITHWCSVPSVVSYARRMRALRPGSMPGLRLSLFAGEPLTVQQAEAWQRAAPGSVVENIYGPTELTVTCTGFRLPPDPADWPHTPNGTVPIGSLHPGLEHVVLDTDGRPAEEGELCVRGPQRFPGYLDPADNAGRFLELTPRGAAVHDGSSPVREELWYRTGDRVRGSAPMLHLGRLDQQVKVAGYRVELGEIESALRAQPGVGDAVVLALPGALGSADLRAVCTGTELEPERLLDALRARLPRYMVPLDVLVLDRMPLNPNGKTDRAALSALLTAADGAAR